MAQEQSAAETQTIFTSATTGSPGARNRSSSPTCRSSIRIIISGTAGWRYLLDELLADTNSGHNVIATVFVQARAMVRADGPEDLRPVGETEFVNGVAAMSASGIYGRSAPAPASSATPT